MSRTNQFRRRLKARLIEAVISMKILMIIFWLLPCWGIFALVSWMQKRVKKSWPILILMALQASLACAYIWSISWKGYRANFHRMVALQLIVVAVAVWTRYMQTKGRHGVGASFVIAGIPLVWLIIQSQWLHLYMIFDASLLDQRITILVGEAAFLLLAYMGWIVPRGRKNGDNKAMKATS